MIISQRTRKTPKWLTAGVVALSIGLLPLGVAYAQDVEAVGKRLRQAVAEGELTGEQAHAMMETLRRSAAREGVAQRIREIEAAMEAGKMSREEGARAIEATKRAMDEAGRGHGRGVSREAIGTRIREIEAAMEAGKMSREEGARAIEATKRAMEGASGDGRSDTQADVERKGEADRLSQLYSEIEARIKRAVESGELSREEAEEHLIEARREIFGRE